MWRDVLAQVQPVDVAPDPARGVDRLVVAQLGVEAEEGVRILEHRRPQRKEPLDVPLFDVGLVGVDVDREVEVVADELRRSAAGLQHVEALDDHDVRAAYDDLLVGHDVVDDV